VKRDGDDAMLVEAAKGADQETIIDRQKARHKKRLTMAELDIGKILAYAISGLGLALALLTYNLLTREQRDTQFAVP
jgi:hypothetical protein